MNYFTLHLYLRELVGFAFIELVSASFLTHRDKRKNFSWEAKTLIIYLLHLGSITGQTRI